MRISVKDVRPGDMMLSRGIVQKVERVEQVWSAKQLIAVRVYLHSFAAHAVRDYDLWPDEVVLVLDRNCQEVSYL